MYLMYGDEADHEQGKGNKYFVYGGAFIAAEMATRLHDGVEVIRAEFGFEPSDSLKFASNSMPARLTKKDHSAAKQRMMALASDCGVIFSAYAILHSIAKSRSHDDLVQFGVNTIVGKFNQFVSERNAKGYVLLDRLPVNNPYRFLAEKFQVGLQFGAGRSMKLSHILGFAFTCNGATHFSSVADIILGSFRYCVNEEGRDVAGKALFPQVVKLMWKGDQKGVHRLREHGLMLRPHKVEIDEHRKEYEALESRLMSYLE